MHINDIFHTITMYMHCNNMITLNMKQNKHAFVK